MRFLKDDFLNTIEINCDSSNVFQQLSKISHGSDIYFISPEQYETLRNLQGIDLVRALKGDKESKYEKKKNWII